MCAQGWHHSFAMSNRDRSRGVSQGWVLNTHRQAVLSCRIMADSILNN